MTTVDELVDVTPPMSVDAEGRLMLAGRELHPCCLEAVEFGHGECTFDGFVSVPLAKPVERRQPIPVNADWRNSG